MFLKTFLAILVNGKHLIKVNHYSLSLHSIIQINLNLYNGKSSLNLIKIET
jgi:hypothetical protein